MAKLNRANRVRDCMSDDPRTMTFAAPLVHAAKVLQTYRIRSLPVVDEQKLVGMLTVADLLRAFVEQNEEIAA